MAFSSREFSFSSPTPEGPKISYAIAYVTLAEGPKMMTNIVDTDLDAIEIGQAVKVVFKETEDGPPVPMFTPA